MLGVELVDAEGSRGARKVVERSIALAQGYGIAEVVENR